MSKNTELILLIALLLLAGKFMISLTGDTSSVKWLALILIGYIGVRKYAASNTALFLICLGMILVSFIFIVYPYLPVS